MDWYKILFNKPENWFSTVTVVASLILPGFVYLYLYKTSVFFELNDFRVVILSAFYSLMMFLPLRIIYHATPIARIEERVAGELRSLELKAIRDRLDMRIVNKIRRNQTRLMLGDTFASLGVFLTVFVAALNPLSTQEFAKIYYPTVAFLWFLIWFLVGIIQHQFDDKSLKKE